MKEATELENWKGQTAGRERLVIRQPGRVRMLDIAGVSWVSAEGDYVRFHAARQSLLVRKTLAAVERELADRRFARIHRSTIVNLDHVVELRPACGGDWRVLLREGTVLRLSRLYRRRRDIPEFRSTLRGGMGNGLQ